MITLTTGNTLQGKAGTAAAISYTVIGGDTVVSSADTFATLGQGQLGTSAASMLTTSPVASSTTLLISSITLANTTGTAVTGVTIYVNGTAASNQITGTFTIPANGTAAYGRGIWQIYDNTGSLVTGITGPQGATGATGSPASLGAVGSSPNANAGLISGGVLTLEPANASFAGLQSAAQFTTVQDIWFDVTVNGVTTSNSAATNSTNIATLLTTTAFSGSTIFFPPGIYEFSSAISPGAKDFRFCGAGMFQSILATTSATADLFTLTDGNPGTEFLDLGFSNVNNKTAGNMITMGSASSTGNTNTHVRRCNFQGSGSGVALFNCIVYAGTLSGSSCILEDSFMSNFSNFGVQLLGNTTNNTSNSNLVINSCTINGTLTGGGNAAAGINAVQATNLQIDNCLIENSTNNLLINPATGSPVQTVTQVYCSQSYFVGSFGSSVKLSSTGNIRDCKFSSCEINVASGSSNFNAFEVSSTASLLPNAIDILDCSIINANANIGTSNGFSLTGFSDINIQSCRIAGWTTGINVTPSTPAGGSRISIHGNTVGPTANINGNTTGITLNAGSFAYGPILINDNNFPTAYGSLTANTTNLTNNAAVTLPNEFVILNNNGLGQNTYSARMTATQSIGTTVMTALTGLTFPIVDPSTNYSFEASIAGINVASTSATAIGVAIAVPAGAKLNYNVFGNTSATTAYKNTFLTVTATTAAAVSNFITTSGFTGMIQIKGVVAAGTISSQTGGVSIMLNAVGTASTLANTATIQAGSWINAFKVN